jgi:hypothetical protein
LLSTANIPLNSGVDFATFAISNMHMQVVHPVTSRVLSVSRPVRAARKMPAPSRLPTVFLTRPTRMQRILRAIGIGA